MYVLILGGWGAPDWIGFLIPVVLLLLLVKGGEKLYHWFSHRFLHKNGHTK